MSFLTKLWQSVKHLLGSLEPLAKEGIHIGVTVTDAIKTFDTANPIAADILTALIPGTLDDTIKVKLREMLPKIVVGLRLVDDSLRLTDPNEIMLAATKVIQNLDGNFKNAALHSLSLLITEAAADGHLTWSDAVLVVESYYKEVHKAEPVAIPA